MPELIKEIVGCNIIRLRKQAGLTQRELGEFLGASGHAVYLWEKGVTWPEADKFDQMAMLLKVPVTEFFAPLDRGGSLLPPSDEFIINAMAERLGFDAKLKKKKKT